jgi:hypothetical protein
MSMTVEAMDKLTGWLYRAVFECHETHLKALGFDVPKMHEGWPVLESKGCILRFGIELDCRPSLELTWPTADAPWPMGWPRAYGAENPKRLTTSLWFHEVVDAIEPDYVYLTHPRGCSYEQVRDRVGWLCEMFAAFCEPLTRGDPEPWRNLLAKVRERRAFWMSLPAKLKDQAFRDEFRSEAGNAFVEGNYRLAHDMYDMLVNSDVRLTFVERLRRWRSDMNR